MSSATQKASCEVSQGGAAFSYAQAAKGRSPSIPSTLPSGKALLELADTDGRRTSVPESKNAPAEAAKTHTEDQAGVNQEGLDAKARPEANPAPINSSEQDTKHVIPAHASPNGQPTVTNSTPSSPSFGTASTSTLPKEDEILSAANGSSDSTWDKQSQGSQNGLKTSEKAETGKEPTNTPTWDEESVPTISLKEAPPPAVNVWQHRREMQNAKAKTIQSAGLHSIKPASHGGGNVSPKNVAKSYDNALDLRKQDAKKKIKISQGASEEKVVSGGSKEVNKLAEGKPRGGEDVPERGTRRASRTIDAEKFTPAVVAPPPPPGDAVSWPTPDSAQGEEKKKAQERAEKSDKEKTPTGKPHGKEKWMPVPYVPSAIFNTPLPPARRGGRPARGGRDSGPRIGSATHGNVGVEKTSLAIPDGSMGPPANSNDHGRAELGSTKNNSVSSRPKRAASAGPSSMREQRKYMDSNTTEKPKEGATAPSKTNQNFGSVVNDSRRASATTQTDDPKERRPFTLGNQQVNDSVNNLAKAPQNAPEREDRNQNSHQEAQANSRPTAPDRRSEGFLKQSENSREYLGHITSRERGEGRGRGNRGRGAGNHAFVNSSHANGQSFSHGHPPSSQVPTPHQGSKSQSNHERHASQSQGVPYSQTQSNSRSYRSGSRSQSIPHPASYGRFPNGINGPSPGPPHLSNLQTDLANSYGYQPGQQGIMSAMPYNAFMEQISLFGMVSMQMEYYFSVDNLCKDMFLRRHMDSQGFVFLSVLAKFNRIKQLTQEVELIRYVCLNSPNIEFRLGTDGVDRLRKREGWQQWVLNKEDRDPSAQNDGPIQAQQPRAPQPQMYEVPQSIDDPSVISTHFIPTNHGIGQSLYPLANGLPTPLVATAAAPTINGNISDGPFAQTSLSAAVPDFAPAVPAVPPVPSQDFIPMDPIVTSTSSFTDEQVESLMIVVRKPVNASASSPPPFPSASSRTFSNGSIDSRTINDELSKNPESQPGPASTEEAGSDTSDGNKSERSRTSFLRRSSPRKVANNASPVFWVKDKETPIDSLPNDLTHESYNVFRRNALQQRELSTTGNCHRDMDILYQFWSHFLIRNFNTRMYEEFRQIAFEDVAKQGSTVGIKNLIQYYDESILSQKVISDDIARDFVDLVKKESSSTERPAFDKLRAAWRNGAFNMKNRKKIDNIIDVELKAELER